LDVIPTEEAAEHDGDPPHSAPLTKSTVAATQVVDKPIENGAKKSTIDKVEETKKPDRTHRLKGLARLIETWSAKHFRFRPRMYMLTTGPVEGLTNPRSL